MTRRIVTFLFIPLLAGVGARSVRAQGYSPTEAAGKMTVPTGFTVNLFAHEPMVRQPVAIEFDAKGRLWVLQYLQYPNPAGLQRAKVDRYSRTIYDRVPEPPPKGPRGADRVTILEDTNGDFVADTSKDFIDGLNLATGIAFGHGGVYILQVPYLLFYPDKNNDDVPDSDPEVLLTGFGMEDAHSVANSLTWGPDGWLYGCQGSTVTANIRGIEFQQGVWRYHPITKRFELFCEGGGNSWGLDFDEHGNLFYSTNNGPFCMLHGVQGGYYWKSFGKHGALHNPHAYGYFEHVLHENFRGGHVTVGGFFYTGTTFPDHFRGKYLAGNLLAHDVYWHDVRPSGSTFRSRHGGELLVSNDTWFAPSDVTQGPDGAVYVADWHDQRTAHPDPDADWDRSNGRIVRIQAAPARPAIVSDMSLASTRECFANLTNPNGWIARQALQRLADRRDPSVVPWCKEVLEQGKVELRSVRALWALYVSGGFDTDVAKIGLGHPDENVRWWTIRLLGDEKDVPTDVGSILVRMAKDDPSLRVRGQLASTAKRLPASQGLPIAAELIRHEEDVADEHLPLLAWWAIESKSVTDRERVLESFATTSHWQLPISRQWILPRLMRRYAAEGTDEGYAACMRLLADCPDEPARASLVQALEAGIAGRKMEATPIPLKPLVAQLLMAPSGDREPLLLAIKLGSQEARRRAVATLRDASASLPLRVSLVAALGESGHAEILPSLLSIVGNQQPNELKFAALTALRSYSNPSVVSTLMAEYPAFSKESRERARVLFFGRAEWAREFLLRVDRGEFDKAEISVDQLAPLALHRDRRIDELVRKHWGSIGAGTPEEILAEVRRLNNDLRAAQGDAKAGREEFKKHCASCHQLFGEGNKVGPDLTTANRKDRDYLLVSLVNPSGVIRKEYLSHVVETTDGRVLTGLVVEQTPTTVTLLDAKNQRTTIPMAQVAEMKESTVSLMPERLHRELTPAALRDLFAYLQKDESR